MSGHVPRDCLRLLGGSRDPPQPRSRPVLQISEDLNDIIPCNGPDEPTLGEAQLARLFTHFMTRPPRRGRPHPNIQQFLSDRRCNKLPEGVLPFSSAVDALSGGGFDDLDESNPLQIAMDDDDGGNSSGFDGGEFECEPGSGVADLDDGMLGTDAVKAEVKTERDHPHTPDRSLAEIQVKTEPLAGRR